MADEKEVKASEEQQETVTAEEQQIAEQVNDAATTPMEAQGQPEEEKAETTLSPEKIAEMTAKAAADASKEALNSFQGRFANHTASQQKELQDMIDKRLEPVLKFTESVERAQVEQLEPEQQVEYYKNKLEEKQQDPAPQVQEQPKMSPQQEVLAETTRQMIQESGLNIQETDEKVWRGWNQNMSTAQLIRLAQKNIDGMVTPKQPAQASEQQEPTPQSQAPPSTSSAPKGGSNRVSTLSDLSQMMANGQIDATQYRAAKKEISNKGYASL
jgi:hypothetical protein